MSSRKLQKHIAPHRSYSWNGKVPIILQLTFKYPTMEYIFSVLFSIILTLNQLNASIWIKNVKSYGPSTAAVGVKCLSLMTKLYLKDQTLSRSRTMVVGYTRNLSVPADSIQRNYLKWVHKAIVDGDIDEYV